MIPGACRGSLAEIYLSNSAAYHLLYNKLMATKTRATGTLPQHQRDYIVQLLALGNTKPEIIKKFDQKYGRRIHPTTIIRLKKQQAVGIAEAHDVLASRSEIVGAAALKQKTYRLINNRLDRAIEDESEIDRLRARFRAGEIDAKEFEMESARYEALTISELTKLSDAMHDQSKGDDDSNTLSPQDHAALSMLMQGINNGNPLQLIQVLNPTINANPNVGSPVPPADNSAGPASF